jgi:hypothetical protein
VFVTAQNTAHWNLAAKLRPLRPRLAAVFDTLSASELECLERFYLEHLNGAQREALLGREDALWLGATLMAWLEGLCRLWSPEELLHNLQQDGRTAVRAGMSPACLVLGMQAVRRLLIEALRRQGESRRTLQETSELCSRCLGVCLAAASPG